MAVPGEYLKRGFEVLKLHLIETAFAAFAVKANAKEPPKKEFPHVNALNLEAAKPPPATAKEPAKFPTTAKKPAKSALAKPKPKEVQFA